MHRLCYTAQAEQDLQQIVEGIARENLAAAVRWLDEAEALFRLLATQPAIGQRMKTRRMGEVRRQILRVLHAARDQESLL